jgi:hypothetical protein
MKAQKASVAVTSESAKGVDVMKYEAYEEPGEGAPAAVYRPAERRVSLEQKIMRLIRRYRAEERRTRRRQAASEKHRCRARHSPGTQTREESEQNAANPLERTARVCSASTLAAMANAVVAPVAPGFVAGRLLSPWRSARV